MRGGNRGFEIHEAEVDALENVAHIREKRAPALGAFAGRGRGRPHRLMRNHIARDGKADLGQIVGIRNNRSSGTALMRESEQERAKRGDEQQRAS
jgi:hypothetical protein